MVIVDSSVWIQFLNVRESPVRGQMDQLRAKGEVAVVGVVMAELLQGARSDEELERLRRWLMALPYLPETQDTWARVGSLSFHLRQRGETVHLLDLVIAALALEHDCEVYTTDQHFQRIPDLRLHGVGSV